MQSRLLMKRSTWCGIVCGLLVVITALNAFPPADVSYRARTELFVSQYRFEHLQNLAHRDAEAWLEGQSAPIQVMGISVLDQSQAATASKLQLAESEPRSGELLLVEIKTHWQKSFSEQQLLSWLDENSQPAIEQVDESLATQRSVASWKLKAAEHYIARKNYLAPVVDEDSKGESLASNSRDKFTLAGGSTKPQFGFASLSRTQPAEFGSQSPTAVVVGGSEAPVDTASVQTQLEEELLLAKTELENIQSTWQTRLAGRAGALEVAQPTDLDPTSSPIPLWMAASILILGCCSAASAGWIQHRLQAGSVFDPARVASQLSDSGVPLLTSVHLDDRYAASDDWTDQLHKYASLARRFFATRIVRLSEWALWFWVYMIAFRLVLDPMWRSVLLESPLAALGRVLVGMP